MNEPTSRRHFTSETHALLCGSLYAALCLGQFATTFGAMFREGASVEPVRDGDDWTNEIRVRAGTHHFRIVIDEVDA